MGKKFDTFKLAFKKKVSSDSTNLTRRLAKADAALTQLNQEIQNIPAPDNAPFLSRLGTLRQQRTAAVTQGGKDGYDALEGVKLSARQWLKDARFQVQAQNAQPLPVAGDPAARLYPSDIPGTATTQQQAAIEAKIVAGKALYDNVLSGAHNTPPTKAEVASLMWFLKTRAQGQIGAPYDKGAMTIEDPNGTLKAFLQSSPTSYNRASSHLKAQQKLPGGGGFGIDFYGGVDAQTGGIANVDELLPTGMRTLLMQEVTPAGAGGAKRLYLKMETEGCDYKHGHLQQSLRHFGNLVGERHQEFKGRREQMPEDVKAAASDVTDALKAAIKAPGAVAKNFVDDAELALGTFDAAKKDLGRLSFALEDVAQVLADIAAAGVATGPAWTALETALQDCWALLDDHFGAHDGGHIGTRFGGEIVVGAAALA